MKLLFSSDEAVVVTANFVIHISAAVGAVYVKFKRSLVTILFFRKHSGF